MSGSQLRHGVETINKTWITQLNVNERSTLVATFAGWMLDGMDVMVYSLVLPTLISLWHISKGEAGLLGLRRFCCHRWEDGSLGLLRIDTAA